MFTKPVTISLSPNTEPDDVVLALKTILSPSQWKQGQAVEQVLSWLENYFKTDQVLLYNSGRSAELEILKAFGIGKGDEVIIQAFTCVAVPNSILWTGATPVYCDISNDLNMDVSQLQSHITPKTKAIIVQHTFGTPAKMDKIMDVAKKNSLLVIEDCAHALGGLYKGKLLGTWGDAAFFSFGRDKVVSSVFGGVALIHSSHKEVFNVLHKQYKDLHMPSNGWIAQQIFHPLAFAIILPLYESGIGKLLLVLLQKLHLLSFPVYKEEKKGKNPGIFPQKYPNALAILALHQLKKLERFNKTRSKIALLYSKLIADTEKIVHIPFNSESIFLRYSIRIKKPDNLIREGRKKGILLGNWYRTAVDPTGTDTSTVGYLKGSCPQAEKIASEIVNLPTLISVENAQKIMSVIQLEVT